MWKKSVFASISKEYSGVDLVLEWRLVNFSMS